MPSHSVHVVFSHTHIVTSIVDWPQRVAVWPLVLLLYVTNIWQSHVQNSCSYNKLLIVLLDCTLLDSWFDTLDIFFVSLLVKSKIFNCSHIIIFNTAFPLFFLGYTLQYLLGIKSTTLSFYSNVQSLTFYYKILQRVLLIMAGYKFLNWLLFYNLKTYKYLILL